MCGVAGFALICGSICGVVLAGSRKSRSSYSCVVLCGSRKGLGDRAQRGCGDRAECVCIWTPGRVPRGFTGCLEVCKMAAGGGALHPRLDSPTFVLECSSGYRTFRSYRKRWRLKFLLQYNVKGFVFYM